MRLRPPPRSRLITRFLETGNFRPRLAAFPVVDFSASGLWERMRPFSVAGLHAEKSRSWWRDRALREMREGKKFFSVDLMQEAV